jgi:hypothetical protein
LFNRFGCSFEGDFCSQAEHELKNQQFHHQLVSQHCLSIFNLSVGDKIIVNGSFHTKVHSIQNSMIQFLVPTGMIDVDIPPFKRIQIPSEKKEEPRCTLVDLPFCSSLENDVFREEENAYRWLELVEERIRDESNEY